MLEQNVRPRSNDYIESSEAPTYNMRRTLIPLTLGILLSACSNKASAPLTPQPVPADFDSVALERTACYGECPIYSVEIRADGQVNYAGKEFVKAQGKHQRSIPPEDVALLSAVVHHVKFEQMREQYQSEADGCVNMPTDFPSFSISVTKAGKAKHVAYYTGCNGPAIPAADLEWLAQTIDVLAQTQRLTNR